MTRRFVLGLMAVVAFAGSGLVLAWPAPVPTAEAGPAIQAAGNPMLVLDTARRSIEI
jgi:hypothetical protein